MTLTYSNLLGYGRGSFDILYIVKKDITVKIKNMNENYNGCLLNCTFGTEYRYLYLKPFLISMSLPYVNFSLSILCTTSPLYFRHLCSYQKLTIEILYTRMACITWQPTWLLD
jgi:hypothetical protein